MCIVVFIIVTTSSDWVLSSYNTGRGSSLKLQRPASGVLSELGWGGLTGNGTGALRHVGAWLHTYDGEVKTCGGVALCGVGFGCGADFLIDWGVGWSVWLGALGGGGGGGGGVGLALVGRGRGNMTSELLTLVLRGGGGHWLPVALGIMPTLDTPREVYFSIRGVYPDYTREPSDLASGRPNVKNVTLLISDWFESDVLHAKV
ncbi:hypothetical protein Tco_0286564 [Tanacetum coccineum]